MATVTPFPDLAFMVPPALAARTHKIHLRGFETPVDIGFHAFEIGTPQRLRFDLEIWLDAAAFPGDDAVAGAWDYDWLRSAILAFVAGRRFNLQETVARGVYDLIAARRGVKALRVATSKPDVYPDCEGVGVELASF